MNPGHREILGEPCYPSLAEIPAEIRIDIVDVFRRSDAVAAIAEQAVARRVPFVFLQLGVVDAAGGPPSWRRTGSGSRWTAAS